MTDADGTVLPWSRQGTAERVRFNAKWSARKARYAALAGWRWYAPGLVVDAELRGVYEIYLPWQEFRRDLRRLALSCLPHASWLPRVLRAPSGGCCAGAGLSLPDFWAALPPRFAGQVTFSASELPVLLCALADPPRYGTAAGRYPDQLAWLRDWSRARQPRERMDVLDVGCGTGQGTYELAGALRCQIPDLHVVGVTAEPLEAWMARQRQTPHDLRPHRTFPPAPTGAAVCFVCGDARRLPFSRSFDLVVANGLVGGPMFQGEACDMMLEQVAGCLTSGGVFTLANHFHDGFTGNIQGLKNAVRQRGWRVEETATHLVLRRG